MDAANDAIVVAPLGRDAEIIVRILATRSIGARVAPSLAASLEHVRSGAAALLVTEESLVEDAALELIAALEAQPSWSELPVILMLATESDHGRFTARQVRGLARLRGVTALRRPVAAVTLLSTVQAAFAARRRQYEVRDLVQCERSAREEAERATRIKDEFLALVSHELRTPLSAILLWSELMLAGRITGPQIEVALQSIKASAEVQSRLIEDLLDLSRMLVGKLRIDARPQPLGPILEAAVSVVRPMADAKRVELVHERSFDATVLGDATRLQQILWNLLSNAVKFTPAGGRVELRTERDGDHIVVTVRDTGEGIAPQLLPHVFERFLQGDAHTGRRYGGLGLGLPIVKQLVELHGGTVRANSAGVGRGTTMTVCLPIVDSRH